MIRLAILGFFVIAGIRRLVGAEAERQGRGESWWIITASLFAVGGLAGMAGAVMVHLASDPAADGELLDATALLGGLVGGTLVALPAWVLLRSRREPSEATPGPVEYGGGGLLRWSLVVLVPIAVLVMASPFLGMTMTAAESFAPGSLGAGQDTILREDQTGTIFVPPGRTLDCAGHKIIGDGDRVGVLLGDGATVRNCEIILFNTAVAFGDSVGATAEQITATNNRIGFYMVDGADGGTIRDSYAGSNEIGYLFERTVTNATVEGNVAERNWGAGFQVGHTTNSSFTGNEVIGGGSGFWITESHDNTFDSNTVSNASAWFSIGVERNSARNVFTANEVSGGGVGIAVFAGAKFNEFRDNDLHDNVKGAHADGSAGIENVFLENLAYDNRDVGLWDDGRQPGERFRGNECWANGDIDSVPEGICQSVSR